MNRQDKVAVAVAPNYNVEKESGELLKFAVRNANEYFLKHAFRDPGAIFTPRLLLNTDIIEDLMKVLYEGSEIEIVLNILIYAPLGQWKQDTVSEVIDYIEKFTDIEWTPSLCYQVYNPLLTICLCCEILTRAGDAISLFK